MNTSSYILAVLMSLPPAAHDTESWEEREARMGTIASAIEDATARATCDVPYDTDDCKPRWTGDRKQLALLLVTKGFWESAFAQNVHEGRCRVFECDATKLRNGTIVHRARTPWQLQRTGYVKGDEWERMVGTNQEATRTAAWVATRIITASHNRCQTTIGTIASYANGRCEWSGAPRRYAFFMHLAHLSHQQLANRALHHRAERNARTAHNSPQ
jgi:hypothetical protein